MGSCWAWSVRLTTRLLGRLSPLKQLTSFVHILSPETDNCPSWISGRERMTVENISWSISMKECCQPGRGWTRTLLITSQVRIQLSHRGQPLSRTLKIVCTIFQSCWICFQYFLNGSARMLKEYVANKWVRPRINKLKMKMWVFDGEKCWSGWLPWWSYQ